MQRNLWQQYLEAFRKSNNGLIQLILINSTVFMVIRLLEVILSLAGALPRNQRGYYENMVVTDFLGLPSAFEHILVRPWTIITTFFTHYGFFHILFNMLFLYWFGTLIKEYLGNKKLVNLYILGGLAGGAFYVLLYNISPYFTEVVAHSRLIGASASVLAIVVGAATLMPDFQFHLLLLGPVKIKYIAIFYVVMALFGTIGSNAGGDIAHLGGCVIGFFYIKQLQKGNDWGTWVQSTLEFLRSFFVKPKVRVTHRGHAKKPPRTSASTKSASPGSGTSQEEIDAILDKISAKGYESLTKEEKQKLFNASNK